MIYECDPCNVFCLGSFRTDTRQQVIGDSQLLKDIRLSRFVTSAIPVAAAVGIVILAIVGADKLTADPSAEALWSAQLKSAILSF